MACFIGLMSGTSLDGIDGVLADFTDDGTDFTAIAHVHHPLQPALRGELLALNSSGADELHRAALATQTMMDGYAGVVSALLAQGGRSAQQIAAIGAHGQTVRHRPRDFGPHGYTLQLMNGARLAELAGVDVVCDFRSRDVAAGGEGAPLVPAFHAARFAQPGHSRAVLNLGGIANITLLDGDGSVRGCDTGPGNVLMDLWSQRHLGLPYDAGGAWAATGRVSPVLLDAWLKEPFLARLPPKSTGRDLFDANWLDASLAGTETASDVMAKLAEFTARSVCDALSRDAPALESLIVCGGGAHNQHLLHRLGSLLGSRVSVRNSAMEGVPPDEVEALAFAWLAWAFVARRPGNVPAVTGAGGGRVLGALYPAG